jgi:hypothetical protein
MTHLKSVSVVLGIALAAVAQAPPQAAAATREATFAERDADTAVPMRTTQDQMNHYLRFTSCLEQHGITVGRRHSPGRIGQPGHR